MVTFIDEWRRKFPSCMVLKRLISSLKGHNPGKRGIYIYSVVAPTSVQPKIQPFISILPTAADGQTVLGGEHRTIYINSVSICLNSISLDHTLRCRDGKRSKYTLFTWLSQHWINVRPRSATLNQCFVAALIHTSLCLANIFAISTAATYCGSCHWLVPGSWLGRLLFTSVCAYNTKCWPSGVSMLSRLLMKWPALVTRWVRVPDVVHRHCTQLDRKVPLWFSSYAPGVCKCTPVVLWLPLRIWDEVTEIPKKSWPTQQTRDMGPMPWRIQK